MTQTKPTQHALLAQSAGFTLQPYGDGRVYWLSPCKTLGGRVKHDSEDQAWKECCQTNHLS